MEYLVLLGLLFIKHALLSHVVDFGYSKSRSSDEARPWVWFSVQCSLELLISTYLLSHYGWLAVVATWLLEGVALWLGCSLERKASLKDVLTYHLMGESMAIAAYGAICILLLLGLI